MDTIRIAEPGDKTLVIVKDHLDLYGIRRDDAECVDEGDSEHRWVNATYNSWKAPFTWGQMTAHADAVYRAEPHEFTDEPADREVVVVEDADGNVEVFERDDTIPVRLEMVDSMPEYRWCSVTCRSEETDWFGVIQNAVRTYRIVGLATL